MKEKLNLDCINAVLRLKSKGKRCTLWSTDLSNQIVRWEI